MTKKPKAKDINAYAIGDEIFRYVECGGVFRHIVQGIRKYDDGCQLEVESQSCRHGWKCRVLLAQNDFGRIVAVHMLNEDEDDPQKMWHTNDGLHFWSTAEEARAEGLQLLVNRTEERIRDLKQRLDSDTKRRDELVAAIKDLLP